MILFLIFIITYCLIYIRYQNAKRRGLIFFITPELQLVILSSFYLIVPSLLFSQDIPKLIDFPDEVVIKLKDFSIYYHLVFLLNFILNRRKYNIKLDFNISFRENIKTYFSLLMLLLSIYILFIILFKLREFGLGFLSLDRVSKYIFYVQTKKVFGFVFISWFIIIWSFVQGIVYKKSWPLLFQSPLILLELICSSRYYIFIFLISFLILYYRIKSKELNLKYVFFIFLIFILFSFLRDSGGDITGTALQNMVASLGEFINTYNSAGLVYHYGFLSKLSPLIYTFQFFIPQPIYILFFGSYYNVNDFIGLMHDYEFGMGSSILIEGKVFGLFFNLIYPVLICLFYKILSQKLNKHNYILFYLFSISIFSVFRGAFLINLGPNILIFILIYFIPSIFLLEDDRAKIVEAGV